MKTLLILLVFISGFLIMSGVHEQRLEEANKKRKVVYKYIPRSAIDEQYYGTPASAQFQGMFGEGKSPWMEANVSAAPGDAGGFGFGAGAGANGGGGYDLTGAGANAASTSQEYSGSDSESESGSEPGARST